MSYKNTHVPILTWICLNKKAKEGNLSKFYQSKRLRRETALAKVSKTFVKEARRKDLESRFQGTAKRTLKKNSRKSSLEGV